MWYLSIHGGLAMLGRHNKNKNALKPEIDITSLTPKAALKDWAIFTKSPLTSPQILEL